MKVSMILEKIFDQYNFFELKCKRKISYGLYIDYAKVYSNIMCAKLDKETYAILYIPEEIILPSGLRVVFQSFDINNEYTVYIVDKKSFKKIVNRINEVIIQLSFPTPKDIRKAEQPLLSFIEEIAKEKVKVKASEMLYVFLKLRYGVTINGKHVMEVRVSKVKRVADYVVRIGTESICYEFAIYGTIDLYIDGRYIGSLSNVSLIFDPIGNVSVKTHKKRRVITFKFPGEVKVHYLEFTDLRKNHEIIYDSYDDYPTFLIDLYPSCGFDLLVYSESNKRARKILEKIEKIEEDYRERRISKDKLRKLAYKMAVELASLSKDRKVYVYIVFWHGMAWVFHHSKVTKLLDKDFAKYRMRILAKKSLCSEILIYDDNTIDKIIEDIRYFLEKECFLVENGKVVREPEYIE